MAISKTDPGEGMPRYVGTHIEDARRLIPCPLSAAPKFMALVTAGGETVQADEDGLWVVANGLFLEHAEGVQLIEWGQLLNVSPNSVDRNAPTWSTYYRRLLQATIRARVSHGTQPEVRAVLTSLYGPEFEIGVERLGNATIRFNIRMRAGVDEAIAANVGNSLAPYVRPLLELAVASGVQWILVLDLGHPFGTEDLPGHDDGEFAILLSSLY